MFPKSVTPSRMKENFEIFAFELGSEDMDEITALDRGEDGRTGPHPDTFDHVPASPTSEPVGTPDGESYWDLPVARSKPWTSGTGDRRA